MASSSSSSSFSFSFSKHVFTDLLKPLVQLFFFVFPAFYTAVFSLIVFFLVFVFFLGRNPQPKTSFVFNPQVTVSDSSLLPPDRPNASALPFPSPPDANTWLGTPNRSAVVDRLGLEEGKKGSSERGEKKDLERCDLFDGRWVYDGLSPRYPPGSCPFVDSSFDCFGNGRPDLNYIKLRWKPKGCAIPRLKGKKMLRLLRGKRLAFVGDSLNRNMWESLLCILRHSLKKKKHQVFEVSGRKEFRTGNSYTFRFADYNCSIEFYRSPFLVRESSKVDSMGKSRETLRLDLIEASSDAYRDADIILFNSGHWWTHEKTSLGKNFYQEGDYVFPQLSAEDAYQKALRTWAAWVDAHINANRTRVFFRGYSWSHFSGGQWNSGGNCDGETEPITDAKHLAKYLKLTGILESVIAEMKTPVLYLNITRMTDYRKDAHPSVYRVPAAKRKPGEFQDCSHWCLPGVPDAWNELLYAMLLRGQFS